MNLLKDNVMVKVEEQDKVTDSGIIIPSTGKTDLQKIQEVKTWILPVVKIGSEVTKIRVGDYAVFFRNKVVYNIDDEGYKFVKEKDLIAKISGNEFLLIGDKLLLKCEKMKDKIELDNGNKIYILDDYANVSRGESIYAEVVQSNGNCMLEDYKVCKGMRIITNKYIGKDVWIEDEKYKIIDSDMVDALVG